MSKIHAYIAVVLTMAQSMFTKIEKRKKMKEEKEKEKEVKRRKEWIENKILNNFDEYMICLKADRERAKSGEWPHPWRVNNFFIEDTMQAAGSYWHRMDWEEQAKKKREEEKKIENLIIKSISQYIGIPKTRKCDYCGVAVEIDKHCSNCGAGNLYK